MSIRAERPSEREQRAAAGTENNHTAARIGQASGHAFPARAAAWDPRQSFACPWRSGCGRLLLRVLEQFLTKNRDFAGGFDPQADLAPVNIHNSDTDILTDIDLFTQLSAQDQHSLPSFERGVNWCAAELYATEPEDKENFSSFFPLRQVLEVSNFDTTGIQGKVGQ
jgi:hypothetical protein